MTFSQRINIMALFIVCLRTVTLLFIATFKPCMATFKPCNSTPVHDGDHYSVVLSLDDDPKNNPVPKVTFIVLCAKRWIHYNRVKRFAPSVTR